MKPVRAALCGILSLASGIAFASAPDTEAVEFYNSVTRHFFVTATASEALGIDSGAAGEGWMRTGRSFQAWLAKSGAPADAQPVCRFYSSGANSHFYTAGADECNLLKGLEARERAASGKVRGWQFEGVAFHILTPKAGQCPAGTTELTRVYNKGFDNGEGSNHRFVDDAALQQLMVERSWVAEGAVFCATAKSTGTNANLPPTTSAFAALAGTWKGAAQWEAEVADKETESTHPLELTLTADGAVTGSGNGCSFTGKVALGDGFRSFFSGTLTASGCADAAFNGQYTRLQLERFGVDTLFVRLKRHDGDTEASITARLVNAAAATPPALPPASFASVAGDWIGTVGWEVESAGHAQVEVNRALSLSISAAGAVSGSGFGCAFSGTLFASGSRFAGEITAAGCENALFNGKFDRVQVKRDGRGLEVQLKRGAEGSEVEIEGTLASKDATPPPPQQGGGDAAITGAWQGDAGWFAYQRIDGQVPLVLAAANERLSFSIAADGTFAGSGYGCTFTGKLLLAFNARSVISGEITASGCAKDVFNGKYAAPQFERDDDALEIELERETRAGIATTRVKIVGKLSKR